MTMAVSRAVCPAAASEQWDALRGPRALQVKELAAVVAGIQVRQLRHDQWQGSSSQGSSEEKHLPGSTPAPAGPPACFTHARVPWQADRDRAQQGMAREIAAHHATQVRACHVPSRLPVRSPSAGGPAQGPPAACRTTQDSSLTGRSLLSRRAARAVQMQLTLAQHRVREAAIRADRLHELDAALMARPAPAGAAAAAGVSEVNQASASQAASTARELLHHLEVRGGAREGAGRAGSGSHATHAVAAVVTAWRRWPTCDAGASARGARPSASPPASCPGDRLPPPRLPQRRRRRRRHCDAQRVHLPALHPARRRVAGGDGQHRR